MLRTSLNKANKLEIIEEFYDNKENIVVNNLTHTDKEAKFHVVTKPTLSIQRKYLQKIEKQIGIRKWNKAENLAKETKQIQHNFKLTEESQQTEENEEQNNNSDSKSSQTKTVDLFKKAKEALSKTTNNTAVNSIMTDSQSKPQKVREIQPMQKRKGFGRKMKAETPSDTTEPNHIVSSVSKPKLSKEANAESNQKTAKKSAALNPRKTIEKVDDERRKLIEKKKQYNERIRKINRNKLKRNKTQAGSAERINTDIKEMKAESSNIRSKSEESRSKPNKLSRKFNRAKMRLSTHNANITAGSVTKKNNYINSITIEEEGQRDSSQQFKELVNQDGLSTIKFKCDENDRIAINLNLLQSMRKNCNEVIKLGNIDNSDQKNSIDEDGKYIKTPELNMGEKYSHKCSDNKLSVHSTEKEECKKTNRYLSSQKKKFIKVAKEIQECKKDLIKMQKISELRKLKNGEESEFDKECKRRKQNLDSLNELIKKRNLNFKHKKKIQEKLIKKDLINFEKSMGLSLSRKSKKIKNYMKSMKRNQTFSRLSSKGQNETINSSVNEIATEKKKNLIRLN